MSSPATYNRNAIGKLWNLADLPAEWPGYAILLKGDLDCDLAIEPEELESIDWLSFSEAVGDFQEQAGVREPDSKLGPDTLKLLREKYGSHPACDGALKTIGDLVLARASRPTCPPPGPELVGRSDEERRICSLWNRYGAAIGAQAGPCGIPVEAALAVFYVESGTAYDPAKLIESLKLDRATFGL